MNEYRVAVVGATGLVGQEFIKVLVQRNFPMSSIHLLASDRSAGRKLLVNDQEIEVKEATPNSFKETFKNKKRNNNRLTVNLISLFLSRARR